MVGNEKPAQRKELMAAGGGFVLEAGGPPPVARRSAPASGRRRYGAERPTRFYDSSGVPSDARVTTKRRLGEVAGCRLGASFTLER